MSTVRIVLFADGGVGIGTGHIFRLYPIFRCLHTMGVPTEMWAPLEKESLDQLGLKDVLSASVDPKAVVAALARPSPAIVVLDTYRHLDQLYESLDIRGCRLAIFDDHFRVNREVALVVNSSPAVSTGDYAPHLADQFLLGPAYASVSSGFAEARSRYAVSRNISSILVALGGADTRGNLPVLLGAILPLLRTSVEICVLSARPISMNVPEHVKLTWAWLDQDNLARRMPDFDLAILAGGTMLWQTACVGVPTLSWPQTTGQEGHAAAWESRGAVIAIKRLDALPAALARMQSLRLRQELSTAGRNMVDGLGASRIAACLFSMLER